MTMAVHRAARRRAMLPCWPLAALMLLALVATTAQAQPVPLPRAKPGDTPVGESPGAPDEREPAPTVGKKPGPAVEKSPEPPVGGSPPPTVEAGPAQPSACLQELADSGVVAVRAADFVGKGQCRL